MNAKDRKPHVGRKLRPMLAKNCSSTKTKISNPMNLPIPNNNTIHSVVLKILSHLKQEGNGRGRSYCPVWRLLCVERSLKVGHHLVIVIVIVMIRGHHPRVRGQVGGDVADHQLELHLAVASPEPNKATSASWGRRPLTLQLVVLSMAGHSRRWR